MKIKLKTYVVQVPGSSKITWMKLQVKNPFGIGYLEVTVSPKQYMELMHGGGEIKCKAEQIHGGLTLERD